MYGTVIQDYGKQNKKNMGFPKGSIHKANAKDGSPRRMRDDSMNKTIHRQSM